MLAAGCEAPSAPRPCLVPFTIAAVLARWGIFFHRAVHYEGLKIEDATVLLPRPERHDLRPRHVPSALRAIRRRCSGSASVLAGSSVIAMPDGCKRS